MKKIQTDRQTQRLIYITQTYKAGDLTQLRERERKREREKDSVREKRKYERRNTNVKLYLINVMVQGTE